MSTHSIVMAAEIDCNDPVSQFVTYVCTVHVHTASIHVHVVCEYWMLDVLHMYPGLLRR